MKTSFARIFVQNSFCTLCKDAIKKKVMEVKDVQNIALYPSDSLVVFNFMRAHQVSEVLNTLTDLGYPPEGDPYPAMGATKPICQCK